MTAKPAGGGSPISISVILYLGSESVKRGIGGLNDSWIQRLKCCRSQTERRVRALLF